MLSGLGGVSMLALSCYNDTFDIYDGAVCYIFYRSFGYGVGRVWVRILLPDDLDGGRIARIFDSLKRDLRMPSDCWSTIINWFAISIYLRSLDSGLDFWRKEFLEIDLIPRYQAISPLMPSILRSEPVLFARSNDPVLSSLHENWLSAEWFASKLRDLLIADSGAGYNVG